MTAIAALILAAGKGTRMKSEHPKVLHAIAGEPLLGHVLAALSGLKPERTVVVVGFGASEVENYLKKLPLEVETVEQSEQKGTGHAVMMALPAFEGFEGDVLILSGDVPMISPATLERMIEAHKKSRSSLTLLATLVEQPKGYGRIKREGDRFLGIVEERDASEEERKIKEVNAGIYLARWADLKSALAGLSNENAQGEYYLTDAVTKLAPRGVGVVLSDDPIETLGVNSRSELVRLSREYRLRSAERWLELGVTIDSPETTWIGPWLSIGGDTVIEQGVSLTGQTSIGARCRIGQHSEIENSSVFDEARILSSRITDSEIGAGTTVGPFAHLRNHASLGKGVRVGNFVEIKGSRLEDGAKASHLSYLGDAHIEGKVNVGAGTITCNYDGEKKHPTVIRAGAFIGSNSTLVAPVTIGEGAYVAAGSVITQDVPAEALAFGRSRQTVKEQWVTKRKGKVR
ncbi:MAG TPA: bifunctional UDP-N-acetylglucosamine diphosphorylase/glucosamine-1-phosphate N-acetyltransferase GlmU [Chroococcales cyanobacterium]